MKLEKTQIQRSFSLPVQDCLSHPWPDLMRIVHESWRQSTDLANWASRTLQRLDVVRVPGMKCLPAWEAVDLYALAFGREREKPARKAGKPPLPVVVPHYESGDFWDGGKICAATLLRKVTRKYCKERGKIVWRRDRRSPEFLYPYPFPVHQDSWLPFRNERGAPCVNLKLPGGVVSLRLRGGDEFRPALRLLDSVIDGELQQQELSICRQSSHGHNGHLMEERRPGGGQRQTYRLMIRFAYKREVIVSDCDKIIATCRTGRDPFLTLAIGDMPPFVLHAPWARQWIVEHQIFLQQFADDLKFEKRWPSKKRRSLNGYRERRCEKHRRRMKSFLQETAHQIVSHASRKNATHFVFDSTDRRFVCPFPWHELEGCLENKCAENGISFSLSASGEVVNETPDATRVEAND